MKRFVQAFLVVVLIATGCRAQVPQSAPVYGCAQNPATNAAYQPLNPVGSATNPPVSGTSYVDKPAVGQWCYVVVAYDPNSTSPTYKQYSLPSNIVGPSNFTATNTAVNLSWTASSTSGVVYVMSRAAAILIPPPGAPALNAPAVAMDVKPALARPEPAEPVYAMLGAPKLRLRLR